AGTLIVDGSLTSAVTVNDGGTLAGSGTTGSLLVTTRGRVTPGSSPGILNTRAGSFASGAVLSVEVNGTTAGTQHDQLNVTGTVNLGNATLNVSGTVGHTSVSVVLVKNDGTDPVTGTFNGLPEGSAVLINGIPFHISYVGGDGN